MKHVLLNKTKTIMFIGTTWCQSVDQSFYVCILCIHIVIMITFSELFNLWGKINNYNTYSVHGAIDEKWNRTHTYTIHYNPILFSLPVLIRDLLMLNLHFNGRFACAYHANACVSAHNDKYSCNHLDSWNGFASVVLMEKLWPMVHMWFHYTCSKGA